MSKKSKDKITDEALKEQYGIDFSEGDIYTLEEEEKLLRLERRNKRKTVVIILMIVCLILMVMLGGAYGVINLIEYNSLKITVDRTGIGSSLTLSEAYNFSDPTSVLNASGPQYMDNVTYSEAIEPRIQQILYTEGSSNGTNYIAYTFFMTNYTDYEVAYREVIEVTSSSLNLQDAMRIMVVRDRLDDDAYDGDWNVYATTYGGGRVEAVIPFQGTRVGGAPRRYGFRGKTLQQWQQDIHYNYYYDSFLDGETTSPHGAAVDSTTGEWMTTPFIDDTYVINSNFYPLEPGKKIKYTLVIWLEGWDPECIDEILGGVVSLNICFTTQSVEEYASTH